MSVSLPFTTFELAISLGLKLGASQSLSQSLIARDCTQLMPRPNLLIVREKRCLNPVFVILQVFKAVSFSLYFPGAFAMFAGQDAPIRKQMASYSAYKSSILKNCVNQLALP